jgi:hypothetical protein
MGPGRDHVGRRHGRGGMAKEIDGFRKKDFRRRMIPPGMAFLLPDSVKMLRQMTKPLYPAVPM